MLTISNELQVTAGTPPREKTIMVKFLTMERPSTYNAIFGRTTLNELKALTSIPHLCMKFLTDEGVEMGKGD